MNIPDFLPSCVVEIEDAEAIALLQQLQRRRIEVPLEEGGQAVQTALVPPLPSLSGCEAGVHLAPIVLLAGFDSSVLEYRGLLPLLATQSPTWAVDLWGFGFTEYAPNLPVNPDNIRRHLLSFLETCISDSVVLVGASLGGAVAIDFALHHPLWVKSLVLIDSVGFSGSFALGQLLPSSLIEWGAEWLHFRKQVALAAALALPIIDPGLVDTLRCSLLHQHLPGWKAAIASLTRSGGYAGLESRIAQVQHPTLILWGEADDVLGTEDATRFAKAISGSQLIWIPRAGHAPHMDQPQAVAAQLLSFAHSPGN